jgi:hypothetical protein
MKSRKLLQEMMDVRVEGDDSGGPYHVDLDFAGDNSTRMAKMAARKYGLKFIPNGPNGFPVVQGAVSDLDLLKKLSAFYGANVINLEPNERGGSTAYLETHTGGEGGTQNSMLIDPDPEPDNLGRTSTNYADGLPRVRGGKESIKAKLKRFAAEGPDVTRYR